MMSNKKFTPIRYKNPPIQAFELREIRKMLAVHCILPVLVDWIEDMPVIGEAYEPAKEFINAIRKNDDLVIGSNLVLSQQQNEIQQGFYAWMDNFLTHYSIENAKVKE